MAGYSGLGSLWRIRAGNGFPDQEWIRVAGDKEFHPGLPPVYIISGGVGASGEQLVHTALAQFPDNQIPVITVGNVRQMEQIQRVVEQAKAKDGIIVYTLVEIHLRDALVDLAQAEGVAAIDLMGPLLTWVSGVLGREPLGQPGVYRQLRKDYFERVAAIEFTMTHDDGKNPSGWSSAEIVLTGVSRTGKTPLSIYLSVLGWKVANVPLVPGVPPSPELFRLDPRRVVGVTIEPGQLLLHRQQRQSRLGASGSSTYIDPEKVYEEVRSARQMMRQAGYTLIDVTDKPIESSADEVIRLITRQTGKEAS